LFYYFSLFKHNYQRKQKRKEMTSEFYEFEEEGKDNTARRKLFTTFIGMVTRDAWDKGKMSLMNIDYEQNRHFAGFRKSAGIWYDNGEKMKCWDRRLVLWFRAENGWYLPFFDTDGNIITYEGRRLEEAAVCTLEVVLRNTASYSIGFLLVPMYKGKQEPCITTAGSWMVIGYFPFPKGAPGSVKRVTGCVTDNQKIISLLLAHQPKHDKSSIRDEARDGDLKPSRSVTAHKRMCNNTLYTSHNNKRRLTEREEKDKKQKFEVKTECYEPEKMFEATTTTTTSTVSSSSITATWDPWDKDSNVKNEKEDYSFSYDKYGKDSMNDDYDELLINPCNDNFSMFSDDLSYKKTTNNAFTDECSMACEDEKKGEDDNSYNTGSSDELFESSHLLDNWHFSSIGNDMMFDDSEQSLNTNNCCFTDLPNDFYNTLYPKQDHPSFFGYMP